MEGKNIHLLLFIGFFELLSFCLLKLTQTVDLQIMRVTIMLKITSLSLSVDSNVTNGLRDLGTCFQNSKDRMDFFECVYFL